MLETFTNAATTILTDHLGPVWGMNAWIFAKSLVFILLIVIPLSLFVLYFQIIERWVIGWIQVRRGPIRVGPWGLGQPIADAIKLMLKERIVPTGSSRALFGLAPVISVAPAMAVWGVVPFAPDGVVLADVDAGLLVVLAMTSMGVYGIILAGWASNSKYAFIGAIRSAAQVVSYEIAMGFALIGPLLAAQSMNLTQIVNRQAGGLGFLEWFWIPLFPLFLIHFISGVAETNRAPFDMAESESELVAGFHVEYSGMTFALFFLAEYANMILVSALSSILFLGGWLSPFDFPFLRDIPGVKLITIAGFHWMALKMSFLLFMFLWLRASFPRYRYDQIMRLGWKVFIPITIVWLLVVAAAMLDPINTWPPFSIWFAK